MLKNYDQKSIFDFSSDTDSSCGNDTGKTEI